MSEVRITGVRAGYRDSEVLRGIDLRVRAGTTTAVLGGSGSGKTTLLRIIAGFLRPSAGSVEVGDQLVAGTGVWVPPERRQIGYVRQDGALFPHLNVADNITFGLPWPRRRHRGRVAELLDLVGLSADLATRRPDQLSGGQQQRVALARALAPRPTLVLLDEPFSSLDTALRASTREAVAAALAATGATAVLVTHDQGEALSFADEVAVLEEGRFAQVASPREIYCTPANPGIACFLGEALLLPGRVDHGYVSCALGELPLSATDPAPNGDVQVMVRPEQLRLERTSQPTPGCGLVRGIDYFGHDAIVDLELVGHSFSDATLDGFVAAGAGEAGCGHVRARVLGHECPAVNDAVRVIVTGPVRVFADPNAAAIAAAHTQPSEALTG